MPDDNDRLADDDLPDDPEDDTEPMAAPGLPPTLGQLLPAAIARMRARRDGKEQPIPVPWPTLATPLGGGFWPGTISVLVGTTGAGKTQWCLQVAIGAATAGHPVYYLALEADDVEFPARALGLKAKVHWGELYDGTHEDFDAIVQQHAPALKDLPIHVDYAPSHVWRPQALTDTVQALRATYPEAASGARPPLVIIDYLQVIGTEGGEDIRERIGRAAYVGREVARTHQAAVILASSTARINYATARGEEREPPGQGSAARFIGFAKESGDVEYSAHSVIVITQEPWPGNTPPPGGTVCHLALAKVRAKRSAWVELRFDGRAFTEPPRKEPLTGTPTR